MPGLTDSDAQLRDLIQAIYDHGGRVGFHQAFKLYADTRTTLFDYLATHHPHLLSWYRRAYGRHGEAPETYRRQLARRIRRIQERLAPPSSASSPSSVHPGGQLSLF